jgi:hypothetical protein
MMNWKEYVMKRSWCNLRYHCICLDELSKITKNYRQNSQCSGQYFNPGPPEYEAEVLTTTFGAVQHQFASQLRIIN